ncbi:hypothetical protein RXV88_22480, partial [Aestuariicoccus sp. MJ-SS9]
DTFGKKKRELTLSIAALEEELARQPDPAEIEANRMRFLELAKCLAQLHLQGTEAEKREIVENAFSNRTVVGKAVELKPHQWLQLRQTTPCVFYGAHYRNTYRTQGDNGGLQSLAKLLDIRAFRIAPESGGSPETSDL